MSSGAALDRWRRSLALRLTVWFALLFTVGFGAIFGALYWKLANELEARDAEGLETRLRTLVSTYNAGGPRALVTYLSQWQIDPNIRNLYIELIYSGDPDPQIMQVPPNWLTGEVNWTIAPDAFGGFSQQPVYTFRVPEDETRDILHLVGDLANGNQLHIARTTDSRTVLLQPLRATFLWVGGGVVVFGFAAGLLAARRATRPLSHVITTARRIIETGSLEERVPSPRRDDEVAELVRAFNTVLDRNAGLLRSMREALDNVAHDLRTPLTRLRGTAEVALRGGESGGPQAEALADCVEQADEVLRLLRAMMEISEAEAGMLRLETAPCDLGELARSAAELYTEVAESKRIAMNVAISGAAPVVADKVHLRQAVANLVDNAIKYTPEGGRVSVAVATEASEAHLSISDTGPGIPETEQARIWERLYRGDTSRSQRGLGLGLSLVRAIVEAHGGRVAQHNAAAGGAVFDIYLPLVR